MRIHFLLSLFIIVSSCAISQSDTSFQKIYYSGNDDLIPTSSVGSEEDGLVICGNAYFASGIVVKVDSAGILTWSKMITNDQQNSNLQLTHIIQTYDTSYVAIGHAINPLNAKSDALILKIDKNGDTLWTKTLNKVTPINQIGTSVIESIDSSLLFSGYSSENNKSFIAKLDKDGNLIWQREFASIDYQINAQGITEGSDSTIYLAGNAYFGVPGLRAFVIALDYSGNTLWMKEYIDLELHDLVYQEGNLFVLGVKNNELIMSSLDLSGEIVWLKSYYYCGDYTSEKMHLRVLHNGNLMTLSGDRYYTTKALIINTSGDVMIYRSVMMDGVDICETKKQGLFMLGYGPLYGVKKILTQSHIGLIRVDDSYPANGTCFYEDFVVPISVSSTHASMNWLESSDLVLKSTSIYLVDYEILNADRCVEFFGGVEELADAPEVSTFPNPSNGIFTIEQKDGLRMKIRVVDLQGRVIHQSEKYANCFSMDLSQQGDGCYVYTIFFEDGRSRIGRLIVNH